MKLCCLVKPFAVCYLRSGFYSGCGEKFCETCAEANINRPPAWSQTNKIPIWMYSNEYPYGRDGLQYKLNDVTVSYEGMRPDCPHCKAVCSVWSIERIKAWKENWHLDPTFPGPRWR